MSEILILLKKSYQAPNRTILSSCNYQNVNG